MSDDKEHRERIEALVPNWPPMPMGTETERNVQEIIRLQRTGRWKGALAAQDRQQSFVNAIRGPDKPSFSDSCKAWLGGHRS